MQLGKPHHHAYVVEEIEIAARALATQLGAGPFFCVENVPLEDVRSRGEQAQFVHNSSFGSCGDAVIELIQPIRLAPNRVEERFAGLRPRPHHVAYVVPDTSAEELRRELDARNLPVYLSSRLGPLDTTLHDASVVLGHDIEIHVDVDGLHQFFAMVRAGADGWDGTDPVRPAPS